MKDAFHRVTQENMDLKTKAEAYDALCRGYGEQEIAARVRKIRQREAETRRVDEVDR